MTESTRNGKWEKEVKMLEPPFSYIYSNGDRETNGSFHIHGVNGRTIAICFSKEIAMGVIDLMNKGAALQERLDVLNHKV